MYLVVLFSGFLSQHSILDSGIDIAINVPANGCPV